MQDAHGPAVIPVVQHVRHQVTVRAAGHRGEEVPGHDLAAAGHAGRRQRRRGAGGDRGQLEQYAAQLAVLAQDLRQQDPLTAADVDHRPQRGEVVARGDTGGERGRPFRHGGIEAHRVLRVAGQKFEPRHAVRGVEAGLAGADRMQDGLEGPDAAARVDQHRPRPHRGRDVGPQPVAQDGQAERARLVLGEHPQGGQRPQRAGVVDRPAANPAWRPWPAAARVDHTGTVSARRPGCRDEVTRR